MQIKHIRYITLFMLIIASIVGNKLIAQPLTAVTPVNNSYVFTNNINLKWNMVENALSYQLQISNTSNFTNILIDTDTLTNTKLDILLPNSINPYFWRLKSNNNPDWGYTNAFTIFSPKSLDSLKLWISADSVKIKFGNKCDTLFDLSGNNNYAIQSDSSLSPLVIPNDLNNHSSLYFDGTNDYLNGTGYTGNVNEFSFFLIFKASRYAPYGWIYKNAPNTANSFSLGTSSNNKLMFWANGSGGYTEVTPSFNTSDYSYFTITNNNTLLPKTFFYKNSTNAGTAIYDIGTHNNNGYIIGSQNSSGNFYQGYISEIILFNKKSDSHKILTENFLRHKYFPDSVIKVVSLGYDIKIPYGFCDTILHAGTRFSNFLWNTGATTEFISINKPGKYWVQTTDIFGFQSSDTVMIYYSANPQKISDSIICLNDTLKIQLNIGSPYTYLWSNSQSTPDFATTLPGSYQLQITDTMGCIYQDTFIVSIDSLPIKLWLGNDTTICLSNPIGYQLLNYTPIDGLSSGFSYLWNTGDTTPTTGITTSGYYSLKLSNLRGCTAKDTVFVTLQGIPPSTNFILSADSICTGDTLYFTDLTLGPISGRSWSIGEGAPISDSIFSHVYNSPGIYTIQLTTIAPNECPNTKTKNFKVNPSPTINFSTTPACIGLATLFTNQSTAGLGDSITSYEWNFDNLASGANNTSALQDPEHQFTSSGIFHPQLTTITRKQCSASAIQTIDVVSSASSPKPFTLVSPQNNQLISDSIVTFKWNPSDNGYFYTIQIATDVNFTNIIFQKSRLTTNQYSHRLTSFGTYFWRVTAHNICNNTSISNTQKFELFSPLQITGIQAWFNPDYGITQVNGKITQWNDISGLNRMAIQSDTSKSPKLISNAYNGHVNIEYDGINDALIIQDSLNINSISLLSAWNGTNTAFSGYTTLMSCNSPIAGQIFLISDAGTSSFYPGCYLYNSIFINKTKSANFAPLSQFKIVSGFKPTSISYAGTKTLRIGNDLSYAPWKGFIPEIILYNNPTIDSTTLAKLTDYFYAKYAPPVYLGYDIKISYKLCDTVISAQANHFTNYLWSTGETTPSIHVSRSGSYWVRATNIFGQISSDTIEVYFASKRTLPDTTVCLGNSFEYNWTPLANYTLNWSNGNSGSLFTATEAGSYHFTLTDTLGCTYKDTFNLYVDSLAMRMSLGEDISLCSGNTLTYTLNNYTLTSPEYLWNTGNTTPNIVVSAPGAYWLQITNSRGCIARDTVMVGIRGEAPVVAFTAPGKCMGETTPFTDQSYTTDGSNVVSWQWNFGDGNNSTSQNPTHNYALPGIYPITLTVTTDSVCSNSITIPTVVYSLPSANFSPITGCNNTPIQFTDQSITHDGYTLQNWQWNFGDLQSGLNNTSTSQHPVHPFDTAGVYSIKIKVESNVGCTDSIQKEVYIKPSPIANFTASNTCEGETTWFSDSSITESWNTIVGRSWEFADGSTSTQPTLSKKYPSAGAYSVNYIIQSINGCIDTITKDAIVHTIPVANFVTNSFCANQPVFLESSSTIANDSITSVRWKINNNLVFAQSPVEFLLPNAGTYNVELVVSTPYQCSDTIQKSITIKPIPTAQFSFGYDANSIGYNIQFNNQSQEANSYAWYSNSNLISTLYSPNYNFQMQGEYPIMMIAQNSQQCTDTAFAMLTMIRPFIDLAISNLDIHNTGNYLQASANLINMSNRDITDLWLTLQINEQQIRERWTGMLHAGESIPFNFRTQLYLATGEELQYGCVEIATPIGYPEDNMDNNQICITKKQAFSILKVFPNPANEEINLWLTSPIESEATIRILSTKGSQVKTWNKQILQKGINQLKLPLIELSNGLYILEIEFNNKIERMKFNIIR